MDNQNNIQDELRGLNSGLPVNNSQPSFSVPEGYFDGLAASILAKEKGQSSAAEELQELSPLLAGIPKTIPYTVPEGYFEQNMASLPFLVNEAESPVLAAISKVMPYSVPAGYFDEFPQRVLAQLRPKAKVVPLFARGWMRAATAAVIGGIVFIAGHHYLNRGISGQTAYQQPADTTQQLVAKTDKTVVQDLQKASTKELDEFIQTTQVNPDKVQKPVYASKETKEVKEMLKGVSEKEIDSFLEQLPTGNEDLMVID